MRTRAAGTPNWGSIALAALCPEYGDQKRLADEIGADEAQLSRWLRGIVKPQTAMRLKLQALKKIPATDWDVKVSKRGSRRGRAA